MLANKKRYLGICLNGHEIYLADLERKGKELVLHALDVLPIPDNTFADGLILDQDKLVEILTTYVRERRLKGDNVIVGVNPRQAVIRPIRLPLMPEKELRKSLEYEVSRYFSLTNATFTMDYLKQGVVEGEAGSQEDVLAIAIKDSVLDSLCELVIASGLKIKALDVEPNAFMYLRSFAALRGVWPEFEKDWAAIDLGASKTMVAFFRENVLQFVHTTPLSYAAEGDSGDLLREFDRAFNYYHLNLKKPPINRVYVWGKQAEQACSQFQEALPYTFLYFSLDKVAAELNSSASNLQEERAMALGLALREVVE